MARKINPIGIRIPYLQTWPSLWHSSISYSSLMYQDLFIRKYVKAQFRRYRLDLAECQIKRTFNVLFISLFLFNTNVNANFQFKPFLFLRSYFLFRVLLDAEAARISGAIKRFFNVPKVRINFKIIKRQKPNFKEIALTANPILLNNYFIRRYSRMNSYKYILKSFRGLYGSLRLARFNLKGLKLRIAGPVRAPRTRRSQIIKKLYFGTTPLQTFSSLILYSLRTRALDEGVVTIRTWMYKKTGQVESIRNRYVFLTCKRIWGASRVATRFFVKKNH